MVTSTYSLREFSPEDRGTVIRLWQSVFLHTFRNLPDCPEPEWFGRHFDAVIAVRDRIWVAAGAGDRPIGFVSACDQEVRNLFVDESHQRQGIGCALLRLVLEERPSAVRCRTLESNHPARRFWERNGFAECGREPSPFLGEVYVIYRRMDCAKRATGLRQQVAG